MAAFDFKKPLARVRIDVGRSHIWDLAGVNAVDRAVLKFRREGIDVDLLGMNEANATIMDKLAVHDDHEGIGKSVRTLVEMSAGWLAHCCRISIPVAT